jgi:hypothetical protein
MNQNQPDPSDQQRLNSTMAIRKLQRQVRIGASNFYWIAGLSLVYTLISLFGASGTFPIGLAIPQIVNGLVPVAAKGLSSAAWMIQAIDLLINLAVVGLFALLGFLAGKRRRWAYGSGMALYGVDALLTVLFSAYAAFAFHLFFLWLLFSGLLADRKLGKLSPPSGPDNSFPKNIGTP